LTIENIHPKYPKQNKIAIEERVIENCERFLELDQLINPNEKIEYYNYEKLIESAEDAETAAKKLKGSMESRI
jgi:hypothetical protein